MFKTSLRAVCAAALSLAAIGMAPIASAAIVTGSWDPALPNPPFVNLGWTATVNLKIDNDCSAGAVSLPVIVNLFGRSFGCRSNPLAATSPFSVLSAEIGIYDLSSNLIVDVLRFNPASFTPFLLDLNPVPGGVEISFLLSLRDSNPVRGTIDSTDDYEFRLALPGAAPQINYREFGVAGARFITAPGVPTETAFAINLDDSPESQARIIAATRLEKEQLVFNAVPEPGSFALALLALGAVGAAASRRARPAQHAA